MLTDRTAGGDLTAGHRTQLNPSLGKELRTYGCAMTDIGDPVRTPSSPELKSDIAAFMDRADQVVDVEIDPAALAMNLEITRTRRLAGWWPRDSTSQ